MSDAELIARLRAYREHDEGSGGMASFEVDECIEAADRIEALTEQLAAARQDAKAAEDELEMQEQEACMMENDYIKLEKERDALEAKLAKAVGLALEECPFRHGTPKYNDWWHHRRATLAEIKGESHE